MNRGTTTSRVFYLCKIKVLGFPFLVETLEEAEAWIAQDEMHTFDLISVHQIESEATHE
jgi:hypothetical protein